MAARGRRRPLARPAAGRDAGIGGLLADARKTNTLPELEPGAILFNRLWPLGCSTIVAGAVGFLIPQVPAIATGYALLWRSRGGEQAAAVEAIEDRDGVEF